MNTWPRRSEARPEGEKVKFERVFLIASAIVFVACAEKSEEPSDVVLDIAPGMDMGAVAGAAMPPNTDPALVGDQGPRSDTTSDADAEADAAVNQEPDAAADEERDAMPSDPNCVPDCTGKCAGD